MFPPLETQQALERCRSLAGKIDTGTLCIRTRTQESEERKQRTFMLGVLVCRTADGGQENLACISGTSHELCCADGHNEADIVLVPPVVSAEAISRALAENDAEIHSLTKLINELKAQPQQENTPHQLAELSDRRKILTTQSLLRVHSLYAFRCIDGTTRSLREICDIKEIGLPPTGTGECTAPKLFNYAFSHNLLPESLAEICYPGGTENIPPCDSRCAILLPHMLGLDILYRDEHIIAVNKPSGLLSVPGRGPEKLDSVETRVRRLFPECIAQPAVHRLDMETSGIMLLAFTKEARSALGKQFEEGGVSKQYTALLDGVLAKHGIAPAGTMTLTFRLDVDNRPHQIWDSVYGKKAVTEWKVECVQNYRAPDGSTRPATRVTFYPHTGRTHQLRLASADSHGFGVPIIGDTLYGHCGDGERLMLHAHYLSFTHPVTGKRMEVHCPAPF